MAKAQAAAEVGEIALEWRPLDSFRPTEGNPKTHDVEEIKASILRHGFVEPGVINSRTGTCIVGHGRHAALVELEAENVPVPKNIRVGPDGRWFAPFLTGDFPTDREARAYLLASNRLVELGGWDETALTNLFRSWHTESGPEGEPNMAGTGFSAVEVAALMQAFPAPGSSTPLGGNGGAGGAISGSGPSVTGGGVSDLPPGTLPPVTDVTTDELQPSHVRMVQLFLTVETHPKFLAACQALANDYGTENVTDTVLEAVTREAHRVNKQR